MDGTPQTPSQTRGELNRIDQQLDALIEITARQFKVARQMGSELESQLRIIDDQNGHMGRTHLEVQEAALAAQRVKPSGQPQVAWLIALVLLAALFVVHFVWPPKK
jgi:hypothetical protein